MRRESARGAVGDTVGSVPLSRFIAAAVVDVIVLNDADDGAPVSIVTLGADCGNEALARAISLTRVSLNSAGEVVAVRDV
jgi:hypothetical protein